VFSTVPRNAQRSMVIYATPYLERRPLLLSGCRAGPPRRMHRPRPGRCAEQRGRKFPRRPRRGRPVARGRVSARRVGDPQARKVSIYVHCASPLPAGIRRAECQLRAVAANAAVNLDALLISSKKFLRHMIAHGGRDGSCSSLRFTPRARATCRTTGGQCGQVMLVMELARAIGRTASA